MVLQVFLFVFGLFEIISNLVHISKRTKIEIGISGRRQHQELPQKISDGHYFYKVLVMLCFGVLFLVCSLLLFMAIPSASLVTLFVIMIFSSYALAQAIVYRYEIKVWTALLVYNIPLVLFLLRV